MQRAKNEQTTERQIEIYLRRLIGLFCDICKKPKRRYDIPFCRLVILSSCIRHQNQNATKRQIEISFRRLFILKAPKRRNDFFCFHFVVSSF